MAHLVELGRAATDGQVLPLGSDDPVIAARAVRRALAAAHRRAADVTVLVLASSTLVSGSVVSDFARRALGPHGSSIRTMSVVDDASDAAGLAACAAETAATLVGRGTGVVLAVGIDAEGVTEAHCLARG
jgi:hypothetical protein